MKKKQVLLNSKVHHVPQRAQQKGIVAVEIAYALPILITVFMVMIFLSDLMLVRHHLNVSLNQATRACASTNTQAEARNCMEQWMVFQLQGSGVDNRCDVAGNVDVNIVNGVFLGQVQCTYDGFAPLRAIFLLGGLDQGEMSNMLNLSVMAPFPRDL